MTDLECKLGQTVQTQDGRQGIVRYTGGLHIAAGEWVGLELADDSGKNDGSVKGETYFQCQPSHGIFVRKESIVKVVQQAATHAKPNGVASNGRNSMTAETARKRQSLMSAGSGPATGSRLSIRSPTRSPTKGVVSSASSTNSASRSGTPATTTRTSDSSTKSRPSAGGRLSMAPPPRSHAARSSISSTLNKPVPKTPTTASRTSTVGSRLSLHSRPMVRSQEVEPESEKRTLAGRDNDLPSDSIQEEEPVPVLNGESTSQKIVEREGTRSQSPADRNPNVSEKTQTSSSNKGVAIGTMENRMAQQKEVEQLKAKIRTLEKKRLEDRDKLKNVEALQHEKEKLENVVQALQKKLKTNQQDIAELKSRCEDLERNIPEVNDKSAEYESEIELATLDKEMAEERADQLQAELDALRTKHEEVELEAEILREENKELAAVLSPEEKASAGWIQLERETERLRQALVLLRDMSQQNEINLKGEVKELQESLEDAKQVASKYDETVERLERSEATNKHLMEQLEAVDTNDEIVEAMEVQREQQMKTIEQLRNQVQELEEHIQVADELEIFRVDEERRLHSQLDDTEALVTEQHQHSIEQERIIEDLEYTLTKFRDVVQGLQSDMDELRRSRDVNELQAQEMSSKSRAMMELNLQLQNSAVKTQLKAIDLELGKMRAKEAAQHLEIVQLFLPDSYSEERNPILALLAFQRLRSQALLVKSLLSDRIRDRPHLSQDDPFSIYSVIEKSSLVAAYCEEFIQFLTSCTKTEFARFAGAPYELEPIERTLTGWIDALRKDELGLDGPDHLQRMIGILTDLSEKLITDSSNTKSAKLVKHTTMLESYAESMANYLMTIIKTVQARLGSPKDDDEESLVFDKKIDQLGTKARTIRYLSAKVIPALLELRSRSMCLQESSWLAFEEAEQAAKSTADLVRAIGLGVLEDMAKLERDTPPSYLAVVELVTSLAERHELHFDSKSIKIDDGFSYLTAKFQSLQGRVDDLGMKAGDLHSAVEFEKQPQPWAVRAKELKAQKIISEDVQEELNRLKRQAQEQQSRLGEKDKQLEEQQIKVELLASRVKETKTKDENIKTMEDELENLRNEKEKSAKDLELLQADHIALMQLNEKHKSELAILKASDGPTTTTTSETETLYLQAQIDQLNIEIISLQSAIRYLKTENRSLRIPTSEAALQSKRYSWLDPKSLASNRPTRNTKTESLRTESKDVFAELIDLAKAATPVVLRKPEANEKRRVRWKTHDDLRYQLFKQKEDLEKWCGWRDDFLKRAEMATSKRSMRKRDEDKWMSALSSIKDGAVGQSDREGKVVGDSTGGVEIVAQSP